MVLGEIRDAFDRQLVMVDFTPVRDSAIGEVSARFDIVLGMTPAEGGKGKKKK
jgi:protocatechuate 3,4-dioxygenase, beta subunit